ncbi:MAG: hypothetical protein ACTS8Z_03180, partial [Candidatus Limnocylindrales bacterium]
MLGVIVGVALLGGGVGGGEGVTRGPGALAVVPSPAATAQVVPPVTRTRALRLDEPSHSGVVVTTQELIVRGRVDQDAGEVRIMLESSGGKPIASSAIDPTGHPRAGFVPFEARFCDEPDREPADDSGLVFSGGEGSWPFTEIAPPETFTFSNQQHHRFANAVLAVHNS